MSFRSLALRSFPRPRGGKQALAVTAAALLVGGCGGGAAAPETQAVSGRGFTFEAPREWRLVRTPRAIGAMDGDVDLVQVTRLPLARAYTPALFDRVVPELDNAAESLSREVGAAVTRRTRTVLGERVRQYDLAFEGKVEEITFVLRGRTNYQLLCRRDADADDAACRRLVSSFRLR